MKANQLVNTERVPISESSVGENECDGTNTLTQLHIRLIQLISERTSNQRHLNHCRTQRRRLEKQISLNAAVTGAKGLIASAIRQLTIIVSLADDPLAHVMRFPCRRLLRLVTTSSFQVTEAYRIRQNEKPANRFHETHLQVGCYSFFS